MHARLHANFLVPLVNGLRAPAEDVDDEDAGDTDRDATAMEVVAFLLDNKGADGSSSTSSMGVTGDPESRRAISQTSASQ